MSYASFLATKQRQAPEVGRVVSTGDIHPIPRVGRVAHGVPNGVDRRRALGNAVVPQVSEFIGRLVMFGEPS